MFIRQFSIKYFRNIDALDLHLNKGLNVFIGENNSGKTAVIDALRICLGWGDQDKNIFLRPEDLFVDRFDNKFETKPIEFDLLFEIEEGIVTKHQFEEKNINFDEVFPRLVQKGYLNSNCCVNPQFNELDAGFKGWFTKYGEEKFEKIVAILQKSLDRPERSIFYELLSKKNDKLELQIHYRYWFEKRNERNLLRYSVWGGDNEGQAIPPDTLDLIRHVYLGALRDAGRDLQLSRGNKLGSLLEKIEPDKVKQSDLAKKIDSLLHDDSGWKDLREKARNKINDHLFESSIMGRILSVDLRFLDSEFRKVVADLRARVPVYSNLTANDPSQKWFEIFQNGLGDNNRIYIASVLGDLLGIKEIEEETYVALLIEEPEAHLHPQLQNILFSYFGVLASQIQVFITSHSPTITAKTALDSIIVFQNVNNKIRALSLRKSDLDEQDKSHLHKFLDVTKAQLFFANGVILTEGICEALLIPVFARIMGRAEGDEKKYNLTKAGVEIVNVNGVSFKSFARLFNSDDETKRLSSRGVIVTDSDPPDANTPISARSIKALGLKKGPLDVQLSTKTFEYDLFLASQENAQVIKDIYSQIHPNTTINNADDLLKKLESNKDKGELAENLARRLDANSDKFIVPLYIQNAIKWVVPETKTHV